MENDWASILADVGIDVPISNAQFNIACPFHIDNQPSLSINIDKGVWICHVGCGEGSLKLFLKDYLKFSWDEVTQYDECLVVSVCSCGKRKVDPL